MEADRIRAAYVEACMAELDAPKPGNVHRDAPGHGMDVAQFEASARASAGPLAQAGARVGERIFRAVEATRAAVGVNTNLGIILLCAPLAAAAEQSAPTPRDALAAVLADLSPRDGADALAGIALANPGGLGAAERFDARAPAPVPLLQAMAAAADRDRIARQYVSDFEDIFVFALPRLRAARRRWGDTRWATLALYLDWLATFPDTHVARKFGAEAADSLRAEAAPRRDAFAAASDPEAMRGALLRWDADLKSRGLNPGTSADLTVATLFAANLTAAGREIDAGHLALDP